MEIKIKDLEKAIMMVLSHLKSKGIESVEIKHDFYWDVLMDDRFNSNSPEKLGVGQLSDDVESVEKLLNGEHEPVNFDLVPISSLLKYIGEQVHEDEGL